MAVFLKCFLMEETDVQGPAGHRGSGKRSELVEQRGSECACHSEWACHTVPERSNESDIS